MRAVLGSLVLLIAGCAAPPPFQREAPPPVPPAEIPDAAGTAIARAAQSLIGSPYRYGGAGPDAFDCSGLVTYVHGSWAIRHHALRRSSTPARARYRALGCSRGTWCSSA